MAFIIVALSIPVLALVPLGLFGLVGGLREREPKVAIGGLIFLLAAAGCGWGISLVVSVNHEITGSQVARAHAVDCTAEILGVRGERAQINDTHFYRVRVRVQVPGKAPFETDSIAAVSPLLAGDIGANRSGYACLADRDHLKKVEILWDQPIR
ncbi:MULTISPECIES: hypothetical protein [unclassified Actinomadura]|uniref:hypothetical protein n=1 Tax=unclassified Actinomadura TaxID=2626254 RepID=UPI0011ECD738|nr:hypothetical protein [Actinomadura sp. K4S16]